MENQRAIGDRVANLWSENVQGESLTQFEAAYWGLIQSTRNAGFTNFSAREIEKVRAINEKTNMGGDLFCPELVPTGRVVLTKSRSRPVWGKKNTPVDDATFNNPIFNTHSCTPEAPESHIYFSSEPVADATPPQNDLKTVRGRARADSGANNYDILTGDVGGGLLRCGTLARAAATTENRAGRTSSASSSTQWIAEEEGGLCQTRVRSGTLGGNGPAERDARPHSSYLNSGGAGIETGVVWNVNTASATHVDKWTRNPIVRLRAGTTSVATGDGNVLEDGSCADPEDSNMIEDDWIENPVSGSRRLSIPSSSNSAFFSSEDLADVI